MKKLAVLFGAWMATACVYAGEVSVLDERRQWVESFYTYPIEFFNQKPLLLKTEYITENKQKKDTVLTVYTGYSMVNTKVMRKDYYISDKVRAAMNGGLVGSSAPMMFKTNEEIPIVGQVSVDRQDFVLVPTELDGFVMLVARDGSVYGHLGQIRDGRLALLDDNILTSPDNFHFSPVTATSVDASEPVNGFDLRYDGIKNGQMVFNYMAYNPSDGKSGEFQVVTFPKKRGNYRIDDVVIRVLNATPERIDYMILDS